MALILKKRVGGAGIEERDIMATTRHSSTTVLRRYIRDGEMFTRNVTAKIGL